MRRVEAFAMKPLDQTGRKVLVVGLGQTGLSVARHLAREGVTLAVTDSRSEPPGLSALREDCPDAALFLGSFDPQAFESADELVVSPGVSLREPLVQAAMARGVPAIGDIELFARQAQAPVIAVTGSNGKSTVVSLLGEMARCADCDVRLAGNIGRPALDLLTEPVPSFYILELSSFQLETTSSLRAHAACVLNVSDDHMDRYDDLSAYAQAKQHIYHGAAHKIFNRDDPRVRAMAQADDRPVWFGMGPSDGQHYGVVTRSGQTWLARGDQALISTADIRLQGRHNLANALAALALGTEMGLADDAMLVALRQFAGLAHRMQWLGRRRGVDWYNDSKATNVGACVAALGGMAQPVVLIAGGDAKGADLSPLRGAATGRVHAAVLIGRDASRLAQALGDAVTCVHAESLEQAVTRAAELAREGDAVLLSPACASLDMFDNYEHRGRVYASAVEALPA